MMEMVNHAENAVILADAIVYLCYSKKSSKDLAPWPLYIWLVNNSMTY